MRQTIVIFMIVAAAIAGGMLLLKKRVGPVPPAAEKPAAEESKITRDENGRVVIKMDDEVQGNIGLLVAKPSSSQLSPEVKGYGKVLDPVALAALMTELATVQAAHTASSNELARLKTLAAQGNTSMRALQTAEAAALRDQLAIQSAKDRLVLSWGKAVAEQNNLAAFVQALTSLNAALVRIDIPAGETLKSPPTGARIVTLSGDFVEGEFLGAASSVDPQTQGRGFIFLTKTNAPGLLPGAAMTGYLKIPGEPLNGVVIPREAVVRTEGAGWVYVLNSGAASFTRIQIGLEHPTDAGWFVNSGVTANDYLVVTGAQTLLSEELKASIKAD